MIRDNVKLRLQELIKVKKENNYKNGWVWFTLKGEINKFYKEELFLITVLLGYKSTWIKYQKDCIIDDVVSQSQNIHDYLLSKWEIELNNYDTKTLKSIFRKLCFKYHPDYGGNSIQFIELKKDFDFLINDQA